MELKNWERNQIKVKITIRSGESTRNGAKEAVDRVDIQHQLQGQVINFETKIVDRSENWLAALIGSKTSQLSIDYEVYLPRFTPINIKNSFGEVILPERDGKVTVNVSYGDLHAKRLNADENKIKVEFAEATITGLNEATIDVQYGALTLGVANKLDVSLSFCAESNITEVTDAMTASLHYSSNVQIGLGKHIQSSQIKGNFTNIILSPHREAKIDLDVAMKMGKFNYNNTPLNLVADNKKSNTSSTYLANLNGGGNGKVTISNSYGNVRIR